MLSDETPKKTLVGFAKSCNSRYMLSEELLANCLRYFLKHGVANLSLRPLAAAVGTSARMLVHHFGSKEELVTAVMGQAQIKFQGLLRSVAAEHEDNALDLMLAFWTVTTARENLPYLRLLLEVQVLALQNPRRYKPYLSTTSVNWLCIVGKAVPPGKNRTSMATLCTAVIDGLILELLSTGDFQRTSGALKLFGRRFAVNGAAIPASKE